LLFNDLLRIADLKILSNVRLSAYTTFGIGGPVELLLIPGTLSALEQTVAYLEDRVPDYKVLGRGSNLLISDRGVRVVISLASLDRIGVPVNAPGSLSGPEGARHGDSARGHVRTVEVQAGCRLTSLLSWAVKRGLSGLEGMAGIPSSIGGSICMNAGTPSVCMADVVESVQVTGPSGSFWLDGKELDFGYRKCTMPRRSLITAARIRLAEDSPDRIRERMVRVIRSRRSTQPAGKKSAGCVFRNPEDDSAGRLIDRCGLKGTRVGDAAVSRKHANFIINCGRATASNVVELMEQISETVLTMAGKTLVPEISLWGFES